MFHEWLLTPVAQDAAIGVPVAGIVGVWLQARWRSRRAKKREEAKSRKDVPSPTATEEVQPAIVAAGQRPEAISGFPTFQAVNLTTKAQILRLHRRGEHPEMISGRVGIPNNEVALILKLDRLTRNNNLSFDHGSVDRVRAF